MRGDDPVTPHLPQRVRRLPGPLLQGCQRPLRVTGQALAQRTPKEASEDDCGNDIDAEAKIRRALEKVIELMRNTEVSEQITCPPNV
ncbi:MAG: hypothetical protein Fur0039_03640 [Rhodocyclaceae bacterium]